MSKCIVRKISYLQSEGLSGIGFQEFRLMLSKCSLQALQASSFVLPLYSYFYWTAILLDYLVFPCCLIGTSWGIVPRDYSL